MTASTLPTAARDPRRAQASLITRHREASLWASPSFWLIVLTIAALLVYASSWRYPFFWVDPIDIGLARDRSVWQILTTSQGYLYYRPFAFFLWKLLAAVQSGYKPSGFHLIHILTHLVNVWLMFALAKRVLQHTLAAGLAALFFAWYPFSYQTVTWVISPQPQATLFMLFAAILYYDGRVKQQEAGLKPESSQAPPLRLKPRLQLINRQIWLSVLLLALALPFQENAVSFGFVIAALEILIVLRSPRPSTPLLKTKRMSSGEGSGVRWYPLLHIVVCLAFTALWFIIPKDPDSTLARFDQATGWYLLQGLIWPVAAAVGPWRMWFPALSNPAWAPLVVVAPLTLLALGVAYWRGRQLPLFFFEVIWFGVMVLPIWATRGFGYVGTSPRILYVAAGGAALMWAGLLALDSRSVRFSRQWKVISGVLIATTLIESAAFLYTRQALHDQTMPAIWDVVNTGKAAEDFHQLYNPTSRHAQLLYVNVPDQITPKWREFPVGFFRAVLMPVSVDLGQYVELQKGVRPQTQSLSVPQLAHLEDYPYNVDMRGETVDQTKLSTAIRENERTFLADYFSDGRIDIREAGYVAPGNSDHYLATFDKRLNLIEAKVVPESPQGRIVIYWDCRGALDPDETIFLHVLDANGRLVGQADGAPLRGLFPLSECQPGEQIRDVRYVALPVDPYTVEVGVYNRATNQRLRASDMNGRTIRENAVTIPIVPRPGNADLLYEFMP